MAGYGSSRKTWLLQMVLLSVAAGRRCRAGRAMHLDWEQGRRVTFERYQRLAKAASVVLGDLGDNLAYDMAPGVFHRLHEGTAASVEALCKLVDGYTLVGLDPLKALCGGIDENSSDARLPLDVMSQVSERTGCAFMVLDHAGKPQEGRSRRHAIRGSSSKFDACQVVYVATAEKGEPTLVTCEKESVTGSFPKEFTFTVDDVEHRGDPRWGARLVHPSQVSQRGIQATVQADVYDPIGGF